MIDKLSTARQGSCIRLSSLVSLACSSDPAVIHGGTPTLRLMRRLDYLIVNAGSRNRPRPKRIPALGSPRRLEGKSPGRRTIPAPWPSHFQTVNLGLSVCVAQDRNWHRRRRRKPSSPRAIHRVTVKCESAWPRVARRRARAQGGGTPFRIRACLKARVLGTGSVPPPEWCPCTIGAMAVG